MARSKPTSALIPAAMRDADVLSVEESALNTAAIESFVKSVGGRTELTDVLAIGAAGSDMDKVTQLLLDPRYETVPLKRLCTMAGVTVADLFASFRKALVARAHIEATHVIAGRIVPVVVDVMTRAAPQRQVCPKCLGTSAAGQGPCPVCQSTGYVQTEPDLDRQKLALELGQLTEKKGGLVVQQNAISAAVSSSVTQTGVLEQLQQAVGDLLFAPKRRGEVVRDDPPIKDHPPIRTPFEEEEPPLPFGDPREEPPPRRRPDLPGEPEEFDDDDDDTHEVTDPDA